MNTPIPTPIALAVSGVEIQPIVVRDQRVLTFAQIDKVHARTEGTAKRNFTENRERLTEGEDYFVLTADEIRTQSLSGIFPPRTAKGTLVTESGYLLLVKSFTDDLAWRIQKELVKAYFRLNPERAVPPGNTDQPAFRRSPLQAEMFGAQADPIKMSKLFGSCVRMSKLAGLKGDDAVLAADDLTVRACGVSPLEMLNHPLVGGTIKRPAPKPGPVEDPTDEPAVGAPSGSGLRSMTQCLNAVGSPLSAVVCNRPLTRSGMLEDRTGETKEGPKPYRVLVGQGLEFGQNVRFRNEHVNTSPVYYLNRFPALLALIEAEIQASRPTPREKRTQRPNAPEGPVDIETARALLDGLGNASKMTKSQRRLYRESGLQAERVAERQAARREEKRARIETMKAEGFDWRTIHQTLSLSKYFSNSETAELRERFYGTKPSAQPPIPPSLQIQPGETVVPFPPKVPAEQAEEFRRRANFQPVSVEGARAFMVQEAAQFVADGDDWTSFLLNRGHILSQVFTGAEIKSLKTAYDKAFPTGAPLVWNGLTH